jgi:hypothetical protein
LMDEIRFAVEHVSAPSGGDFQVLIFVNDVEMTAAGAGLGGDPYDVLVPVNKFLPRSEPHTFGVARCVCGDYGCSLTDVTISTEGQVVTWTWSYSEPVNRPVEFALADYLREVRRLESDHSWETPDRTAGRLVLTQIDRQLFQRLGLQPYGVGNEWQAPELFRVMLMFEATYQIFLRFPWNGDTPEALAARVLATINDPSAPAGWPATWHSMPSATRDQPPRIAQPGWTKEPI